MRPCLPARRRDHGPDHLAEALVARGLALAYRRYSKSYIDEEHAAKLAECGAWAGEFDPPWKWRRREGQ